jgi:hypothetical protein
MAFHVEISKGFRHARAFNLAEETVRETVLDPWVRGRVIVLGDKEWEPRESRLVVLEGPELADTDLAMGRGWSNAEKSAENVTRRLVDEALAPAITPLVAVLAETDEGAEAMNRMLELLQVEPTAWHEVRALILGDRSQREERPYAAVLAFETPTPPGAWLFDAGLARGALGGRAVVAQIGETGIPVELAGVEVVRLDPGDQGSVRALAARLGV